MKQITAERILKARQLIDSVLAPTCTFGILRFQIGEFQRLALHWLHNHQRVPRTFCAKPQSQRNVKRFRARIERTNQSRPREDLE